MKTSIRENIYANLLALYFVAQIAIVVVSVSVKF